MRENTKKPSKKICHDAVEFINDPIVNDSSASPR